MTLTKDRPVDTSSAAIGARRAMIDCQLRPSGVNEDFVLAAMGRTPREDFVPDAARGHAYIDRAIPLGNGRSLPAPLIQGRMLAEAMPTQTDTALLISCGSDYLAELLRPLVGSLTVVDAAAVASRKKASHSLIVIDGAIEQLPDTLANSLAEGGRIVTGLVEHGVTRLAIGRKLGGSLAWLPLSEIGIPVLAEFAAPKQWSF